MKSVGFSLGNYGYIGTGVDTNGNHLADFWQYDPSSNTWTQKANFAGGAREGAVGFSIGTKGYIGTGFDGNNYYDDFWEYSPSTNSWIQKANYAGSLRAYAAGFSIGNKGYIGTGKEPTVTFISHDLWEWDQATNSWTLQDSLGDIGNSRYYAVGFAIGTKGYIGTGTQDGFGNMASDFWEFDPNGVGVNEINLDNLIEVYPNPTNGQFQIQANSY